MKKIVIINGHPNKESFNYSLTKAYVKGAESKIDNIDVINLIDLDFNPNMEFGYSKKMELEQDLQNATKLILNADHLVWVFPMWWYSMPAIMKGFIDRVFLPGTTFQRSQGNGFPGKLLKGKTARIIITADSPRWYDYLFMKSPAINQLKKGTLEFCGIKPVKTTYISPIKNSSEKFRQKQLQKVEKLGTELC